jgi:hypothetical protein
MQRGALRSRLAVPIPLPARADMAYPVHEGERATGYGVALLTDLCGSLEL